MSNIEGFDPYNVMGLVNSAIAQAISVIPEDVISASDWELVKNGKCTEVEKRLRLAWTLELDRAYKNGKMMNINMLYSGIISKRDYFNKIITNSYKLAFIIRPFPEYDLILEDILRTLTGDMLQISKAPIKDENGRFDSKIIAAKIALWKDVNDRKHGQATQHILKAQVNVPSSKDLTPEKIAEIDRKLAELKPKDIIEIATPVSEDKEA